MALHGEIMVNGRSIAHWEAIRWSESEASQPGRPEFIYKCSYMQGADHRHTEVTHLYDDGAAVLAAKVMTAFSEKK